MDGWTQMVIAVYRPYESGLHTQFWTELTTIRNNFDDQWILEEDFNITRFASERRGKDQSSKYMEEFNDFINRLDLIDMPLTDRLFTWSNIRLNPIMAKLDRVLVLDNWDVKFPLAQISSLQRPTSDHIHILLILGEIKQKAHKRFHFEK